jgi:predicted nucleotidyltransferase
MSTRTNGRRRVTDDGFGPESDLDLLVEFELGTEVTLFDMVRMERELGELIGMPVDLRCLLGPACPRCARPV